MNHYTVLIAMMWGCSSPGTTTDSAVTTDSSTAHTTTDLTVPEVCEPLPDLEPLPIELVGQVQYTLGDEFMMELVDVELTKTGLVAAGVGGVLWFDISTPEKPTLTQRFHAAGSESFHRVEVLTDSYTVAAMRNTKLVVIENSPKGDPISVYEERLSGVEGLTHNGDTLYVSDRELGLLVYDTAGLPNLALLTVVKGLVSPWELSDVMDGWMYAADNTLGVVPIDVTTPTLPIIHEGVTLPGSVLHVTAAEQTVYASMGSAGVAILDVTDPAKPAHIATADVSGSAVSTSVSDGVLFIADNESLTVFDVSDPSNPVPAGRVVTEQFALAVAARDDMAFVGDWSILSSWRFNRDSMAPVLDTPVSAVGVPESGGTTDLVLINRGRGELIVSGATVSDDRLSLRFDQTHLAPGEQATVSVDYTGDSTELDAEICLQVNDPLDSTPTFPVHTGTNDPAIGQFAPDFTLLDLDGFPHTLSKQLGQPVLINIFAYW